MDWLEHYFYILIQCVGAIYCGLSVVLMRFGVPHTEDYLPYRKAKRCLAACYLVMALNLFAYLAVANSESWLRLSPYVKGCDFVFFYIEILLFCYSFIYLVDARYVVKGRIGKDICTFVLSSALMMVSVWMGAGLVSVCLSVVSFLMFFVQIGVFLSRFQRLYAKKQSELNNYFSEDMQLFMFWIKKSLFFIVLTFVLGCSTLLFGLIYNYLYQIYVVTANFYIATSFINYFQLYGKLNCAVVTEQDVEETLMEEQKNDNVENFELRFGQHVEQWVSEKKYLESQLTIEDLATTMGTNKLYMSRYINTKYNATFRAWITGLRMEEAKNYMRQNPNLKMEEVAFHSGFSSLSYFSKVFSRTEGMTPIAWRKENLSDD